MVPDDLVCFFLSSTCMTVIWNSTIIRTARKRRLGSCFLELPCQYFYPPSLVSCSLELSFLFCLQIFTLFIGFYTIFSLYLFFWTMFHYFHSLMFLRSTSTHPQVPTSALCSGAVWLGCLCVWLTFSYSTILTEEPGRSQSPGLQRGRYN